MVAQDKSKFMRLYNLCLSYLMILVLSVGVFIAMFSTYLFFKPVQLYFYVAIASLISMIPSLIGFVRTYLLTKKELKLMHNGGTK